MGINGVRDGKVKRNEAICIKNSLVIVGELADFAVEACEGLVD